MTTINGTPGNDTLTGTDGVDVIDGMDGDDIINVGFGADTLIGGNGDDRFVLTGVGFTSPTPPIGSIDGGSGIDTIDATAISYSRINFSTYNDQVWRYTAGNQSYVMTDIEVVRLGSGRETLRMSAVSNHHIDFYMGGGIDDVLMYAGVSVFTEDGDDTVLVSGVYNSEPVFGHVDGGAGTDTLTLNVSQVLDLAAGTIAAGQAYFTVVNFENVRAFVSNGYDTTVRADDGANMITAVNQFGVAGRAYFDGRGGDDVLVGAGGDDTLLGGDGDDSLTGGLGNDLVDGGAGIDRFIMTNAGTVDLRLTTAQDTGSGLDTLISIENVQGSSGDDVIVGSHVANALLGGGGHDRLEGGAGDDSLTGGAGDDLLDGGTGTDTAVFAQNRSAYTISYDRGGLVVNGEGRDVLSNIEQLQFADGLYDVVNGVVADTARQTLTGTTGGDRLQGGGSNDTISGLGGNDILNGGGGSDVLHGGAGLDTAVYAGIRLQYSTSSTAVSGGPEGGTDTLASIEELRFVDGVLSFDENGVAAQVMRLYDAALDRLPDQGGLEGYARLLQTGAVDVQQLAKILLNSDEFQARYGALSNQAFIEQLYRFCLDREGDPGGIVAWTGALEAGMPRDGVLLHFSESAEHRAMTASALAQGLWVPDQDALIIARLYDATFDRLPDPGGLAAWTAVLEGGRPLIDIAAAFAASDEFQNRYGALSNKAFVEQIYRASLDREGDPGGIAAWTRHLDSGASRASVLLAFSESAEHVALTAPFWSGGVRFQGYEASPSAETLAGKTFEVLPAIPTEDDFVGVPPRSQIQVEASFDLAFDLDRAVVAVETPVAEIHLLAPLPGGDVMAPQDRCSDDWLLAG